MCGYAALHHAVEYLDQVPAGDWSVVTVCRTDEQGRKWDWGALLVDVPIEELKGVLKVAFLWVHPDEYRPDPNRVAREIWVRVPGKHRNQDRAWEALEEMMAARLH
jgi:hypothetical protein